MGATVMKKINHFLDQLFGTTKHLPAGNYHYQAPAEAPLPYRLHLRIDPDGEGILILNAKTVLHLNQTAAEYAYHLVQQTSEEEMVKTVAQRYEVDESQIKKDYQEFTSRIDTLVHTPDLDPVTYFGFDRVAPYSKNLLAPYRLDCALTYRVPEQVSSAVAPLERVKRELTTEEWKTILQKAWQAGIPQVVFTGGEPTLRDDLAELIRSAEDLGLVSGLLTDGLRLANKKYRQEILQSGLDHAMLLLNPEDKNSWKALEAVMAEDLFVTAHVTITQKLSKDLPTLLTRLAKTGVKSLSISVDNIGLKSEVKHIQQEASNRGMSLVWDIPVPYADCHPIALEMLDESDKLVEGAGNAWLYVEPDGDVLPAQGINRVLGNLLTDEWKSIWNKRG
jgi:organic radical activating enzyme